MILLKILLIIIAVIPVIFALLIFLPSTFTFFGGSESGLFVKANILGIKITKKIFPTEKNDDKKNKDKDEKKDDKEVSEKAERGFGYIKKILSEVWRLLRHIHIKKFYIRAVAGGEDAARAAMDFGLISTAVYAFWGFVSNKMKVEKDARNINIGCNFSGKGSFEFELSLSLCLIFALKLLFVALKTNKGK